MKSKVTKAKLTAATKTYRLRGQALLDAIARGGLQIDAPHLGPYGTSNWPVLCDDCAPSLRPYLLVNEEEDPKSASFQGILVCGHIGAALDSYNSRKRKHADRQPKRRARSD
jgi:hypothetical protein